jgi:hypothetical protein
VQQAWRGAGSRKAWESGTGGPHLCVQQVLARALQQVRASRRGGLSRRPGASAVDFSALLLCIRSLYYFYKIPTFQMSTQPDRLTCSTSLTN